MVDEGRDGFIVRIDAANGLAVFILQGSEGAPFVDDKIGSRGGDGESGKGDKQEHETADASIRCQPVSADWGKMPD